MKKTFTFLTAVVLMTTAAFAQRNDNRSGDNNYGNNNSRDVVVDNNRDWHDDDRDWHGDRDRRAYYFAARERDMQIAQINREYNHRIESVKCNFFMGRYKKERIINALQCQRDDEIRSVMVRFNRSNNLYGQRDDRHHDRDNRNW